MAVLGEKQVATLLEACFKMQLSVPDSDRNLDDARQLVASEVVRQASTAGLSVSRDDVLVTVERPDGDASYYVFAGRWRPESGKVELYGGPHDGARYEVDQPLALHQRLMVPPAPGSAKQRRVSPDELAGDADGDKLTYRVASWRTDERMWVAGLVKQA